MPPLDDPNNPFASLLQESEALNQRGRQSLMDSLGTPQLSTDQLLPLLLGSALPAAIGGIFGGSTGLQAGAMGGAAGAEFGIKQAQADAERRQKLAQLTATQDLEQAQQLRQQAFTGQRDMERERVNEERDAARFTQQEKMSAINNAAIADRMSAGFANQSALLDKRLASEKERSSAFNSRANTKLLNTEQKDMNSVFDKDKVLKTIDETKLQIAPAKLMLENPNAINVGALQNSLAGIYGEKGVKTEQDVYRALPKPLVTRGEEFLAYLTANPNIQTLPPEYVTAIKKNISDIESALNLTGQKRVESLSGNLPGIAEYTADQAPDKIIETKSRYASRYGGVGSTGGDTTERIDPSTIKSKDSEEYRTYVRQRANELKAQKSGSTATPGPQSSLSSIVSELNPFSVSNANAAEMPPESPNTQTQPTLLDSQVRAIMSHIDRERNPEKRLELLRMILSIRPSSMLQSDSQIAARKRLEGGNPYFSWNEGEY